ncbi:MAG TPA: hypothetical protein VLV49_10220 [Terriglobales bacterium]|nr:hypothetical protein [Terriglobales bacterium]
MSVGRQKNCYLTMVRLRGSWSMRANGGRSDFVTPATPVRYDERASV